MSVAEGAHVARISTFESACLFWFGGGGRKFWERRVGREVDVVASAGQLAPLFLLFSESVGYQGRVKRGIGNRGA